MEPLNKHLSLKKSTDVLFFCASYSLSRFALAFTLYYLKNKSGCEHTMAVANIRFSFPQENYAITFRYNEKMAKTKTQKHGRLRQLPVLNYVSLYFLLNVTEPVQWNFIYTSILHSTESANSWISWLLHQLKSLTLLCGSRKNPYPPCGRSLEIPRGRGGG